MFVALVNIDIFQMTVKFSLFTADYKSDCCYNIVSTILSMQKTEKCVQM